MKINGPARAAVVRPPMKRAGHQMAACAVAGEAVCAASVRVTVRNFWGISVRHVHSAKTAAKLTGTAWIAICLKVSLRPIPESATARVPRLSTLSRMFQVTQERSSASTSVATAVATASRPAPRLERSTFTSAQDQSVPAGGSWWEPS